MKDLLHFLKSQRSMAIASVDENIWIANIFYGVDDKLKIYFISPKDTLHSKHFLKNSKVAFSVIWYDKNDFENRKGVQGRGICKLAKSDKDIKKGVELHNKNFPVFKKRLTFDYIKKGNSCVWVIEPKFIKYWDDSLYKDKIKEFNF